MLGLARSHNLCSAVRGIQGLHNVEGSTRAPSSLDPRDYSSLRSLDGAGFRPSTVADCIRHYAALRVK